MAYIIKPTKPTAQQDTHSQKRTRSTKAVRAGGAELVDGKPKDCEHERLYYNEFGLTCKWCPKYFRKVDKNDRLVWLGEEYAVEHGGRRI